MTEVSDIEARAEAATWAVQFWGDFNELPHREFAEKYPWLNQCQNVHTQEHLLYALARGAIVDLLVELKTARETLAAVEEYAKKLEGFQSRVARAAGRELLGILKGGA